MKEWLERMSYRIAGAMSNRNGADTIGACCIAAGVALTVLSFFTGDPISSTLALVALGYALFRCYSANVSARRRENEAFVAKTEPIVRHVKFARKKFANRKTTRYFTCPDCKTAYSVPKGKGKIRATCPKCHSIHEHTT